MLKEDFVIIIDGKQTIYTNDNDTIEDSNQVNTLGTFAIKNGKFMIAYEEMDEKGHKGGTSIIKYYDGKAEMTKGFGKYRSELIMEPGKKHLCAYQTPYGAITMGIHTSSVEADLNEDGGTIKIVYNIYFDAHIASSNIVDISVKRFNS